MLRTRLFILLIVSTGCISCVSVQSGSGLSTNRFTLHQTGSLQHAELLEVSGIAHSRRQPHLLWMINDKGNPAVVYGADEQGHSVCRIRLPQLENRDWEDLAAFTQDGESWLVIGEIGDNKARYETSFLYFLKEPKPDADGVWPTSAPVKKTLHFQYDEGPRDVEGLAVDVENETIWLVSKRTKPPFLYTLPLNFDEQKIYTAEKRAHLTGLKDAGLAIKALAPKQAKHVSKPTAMDYSPVRKLLAVMTYGHLYLYPCPIGENPIPAVVYRLPYIRQAESVCFTPDGESLFITSEKKPSPLYRLSIPLQSTPSSDP